MEVYKKLSDSELVALLKQSDPLAYTEIFERYTEVLLRHAFRLLNDQHQAQDTIQDIFLNLWQKRENLEIRASLSSLLYSSVRNKIFDLLAHQKVVIRYAESAGPFLAEGHYITDDLIREKELAAVIEREIDALPPKMKEVFLLNKMQSLSYKEISERLGITDQTAKQQVYKALKLLKKKIDIFRSIFPFV